MSDSELIDWEQLSMIFGEEDEEFDEDMGELFEEFIEDGNERLVSLKGATFPDQKEFIAKEAHKLKGSGSNFGFAKVSGLLGHIEDDIDTITQEDFEASLASAASGFEASIAEVRMRYTALKK